MTKQQIAVVETDAVVATMCRARAALAEAKTIQQTKRIVDAAAAAEIYARRQKLGEEASDLALSIKIDALRKLGEMLKSTPKAKGARSVGGDYRSGGSILVPPEKNATTLEELGLSKKESAVAQKLASLPENEFEQVRDGHITVAKAIAAVEASKPKNKSKPAKSNVVPIKPDEPEDDGISAEEQAEAEIEIRLNRESYERILSADDKVAALDAEVKRLNALLKVEIGQKNRFMNEAAEWKRRALRAERKAKAAA